MPEVRNDTGEGGPVSSTYCGRAVVLLGLLGCASTSPRRALHETSALVKQQSGHDLTWLGEEGEANARRQVSEILRRELTLDSAVRVSLLANRDLQASYEEVGIAQADLVQAGLLKNPTVAATYRFPLDPGEGPGIELSAVADLIQLITMPSRKNIAQLALDATKYRVAGEVLHHVYTVKTKYFAMVAATQSLAMRTVIMEAALAAVELARRQHQAGTINDLDLANEEALYAQISVDTARSRADAVSTREDLNAIMGVWGPDTHWAAPAKLPDLPPSDLGTERLESLAVGSRLDLAAARKDIEVISYGLALAKNTRWFGGVDAGVSFERKPERISLIGPTVSVEIPIFDQRQAAIARMSAQLRQARNHEAGMAISIRAEVRKVVGKLAIARGIVESYQRSLVPAREQIVELSQQQYDAMLLGVFQVLVAKQNEISSYRELIEALRDYWYLRAELEWLIGGTTAGAPAAVTQPAPPSGAAPPVLPAPSQGASPHEHHAP